MKTILSLTTGMQKMLIVTTFGLFSFSAKSTGNHKNVQPVVSAATIALPVEPVSFTALFNNNKADLKWTAAAEIKVSHFVIEKSTDGINYHDAAVVFAFEDATDKTNYSYSDKLNNNKPAVVYYRLCVVAENGQSDYSVTHIIRTDEQTENAIVIVRRDEQKVEQAIVKN